MCGIAGIIHFDNDQPVNLGQLEPMAAVLAHRGPDDSGFYIDPETHRCGLAHRRLSIIDLHSGHQPMSNEDQSIWICYNGECYNFQQLRSDLQQRGHRFKSLGDTEVIVHLYEEFGPDCLEHLRGMFALAIWDQNKQSLFLARDRLGQKPLFYALHQGRFIFASQPKAILQTENFPRQPDTAAIMQYLLLQYVPHPQTAFTGIKQLPPAHSLLLDCKNFTSATPQRYWSLPAEPTFNGSFEDAQQALRHELSQAVRMRMISDVPLGAFLSGGLDSAIIVALMSQSTDHPIKTCSIGFEHDLYNELPYATQVARQFNCDHAEHIVQPNCAESVEKLCTFYDEPFADSSALPTWHLSQLARSHVTVALSGDGGDECFGGYERYRALHLTEKINRHSLLRWLAQRKFWQRLPASEHHARLDRLKRLLAGANLPPHQRYLKWMALFDPTMIENLCKSDLIQNNFSTHQLWQHYEKDFQSPPNRNNANTSAQLIHQAMQSDAINYLPGDINTKIDRAGMSVALELRSPFQDHKLMELAHSLPTHFLHNGRLGKLILRRAYSNLLPEKVLHRKKLGFGVPVGRWFRHELREIFSDTVLGNRATQRGYFNRPAIENLLKQNDQKLADHGHKLWALLILELWHRKYIDSP
ncbi:MAG: asparagine synthase (glutamine-hydrolyzing) [Sedimentisphaerales bacterium]|nr:asparagine synthase (glutamine-hydrolyzing) [Sedimentisphaerales bacterium]